MTIFDNESGARVCITTQTVNVEFPEMNAKGMIKTNVTYWATATDQYQVYNGVRRRLFVDASVDFGFGREIWLEDGPVVTKEESAEDEASTTFKEVVSFEVTRG